MHLTLEELRRIYFWLEKRIGMSEMIGDDAGTIDINRDEHEISDYLRNQVATACLALMKPLQEYTHGPCLYGGGVNYQNMLNSFLTSDDDRKYTGEVLLAQRLRIKTGEKLPDPQNDDEYQSALALFERLAREEIRGLLRDFKLRILDPFDGFFAVPIPTTI